MPRSATQASDWFQFDSTLHIALEAFFLFFSFFLKTTLEIAGNGRRPIRAAAGEAEEASLKKKRKRRLIGRRQQKKNTFQGSPISGQWLNRGPRLDVSSSNSANEEPRNPDPKLWPSVGWRGTIPLRILRSHRSERIFFFSLKTRHSPASLQLTPPPTTSLCLLTRPVTMTTGS